MGFLETMDLADETTRARKRLICESEALAAYDRHLAGRFETLLGEAVADDLGEPPDALRPRMVAAAAIAALFALDDEHPGSGLPDDPMAEVDTALVFLRAGLAALQDAG